MHPVGANRPTVRICRIVHQRLRPVIRLFQFPPAFGLPNASPFCMKVEMYLRMTWLPYSTVPCTDPRKAPKGKLPYIDDEGTLVADSSIIISHLKERYGDPLDAPLSGQEHAVATAFQRLMEEDLYWAVVYTRWIMDAGWAVTRSAFFDAMPAPMRWIAPPLVRRGMAAELRGHGMGRHTAEEVFAIGRRDVSALSSHLADKPFMLGGAPTSIDATAYAFLANLLWTPVDSPIRRHALELGNLAAYCLRMKQRYGA